MNKYSGTRVASRCATAALAALLAAGSGLMAQQTGGEEEAPRASFFSRLSVGGSMTVPINGLIREGESKDVTFSTSGRVTTTLVTHVKSESTLKRVGGGVTLFLDLNDRFSVGTNVLYRRAGYDRTTSRETSVSSTAGTEIETEIEKTKADYWDIPVVTRINLAEIRGLRTRVFFTGGGAARLIRGIDTHTEFKHSDGSTDTSRVRAVADAPTSFGAVVGGGFQWQDDIGMRFTPEFRYTHWLDRAWDRGPTRSTRGQIEFILSVTF